MNTAGAYPGIGLLNGSKSVWQNPQTTTFSSMSMRSAKSRQIKTSSCKCHVSPSYLAHSANDNMQLFRLPSPFESFHTAISFRGIPWAVSAGIMYLLTYHIRDGHAWIIISIQCLAYPSYIFRRINVACIIIYCNITCMVDFVEWFVSYHLP